MIKKLLKLFATMFKIGAFTFGGGECMNVCPTGAIKWKGVRHKETADTHKKAKTATRAVSFVLMLAILIGAYAYYWATAPEIPDEESSVSDESSAPDTPVEGNQVGNLCYDGNLNAVSTSGIANEKINVLAEGKITVINFWGTWCTPCVGELPYFDQIATDYADTVSVVAIHTNMVVNTAGEYIATYYPDSKLVFACDEVGETYYKMLGGRGTYPYTVVVDQNGVIARIFVEALEYKDLQEVVEELLAK